MKVVLCTGSPEVISHFSSLWDAGSLEILHFAPSPSCQSFNSNSSLQIKTINCGEEFSRILRSYPQSTSCISCFSSYIFSRHDISHFKKPILNFHTGKIPENRGRTPLFWDIIEKQQYSFGTLHAINEEIDMGRILQQVSVLIESQDNPRSLASKLLSCAFSLNIFLKWIQASPHEIFSKPPVTIKGSYKRGFTPRDNFSSTKHSASEFMLLWRCFQIWGGIYIDGIYYTSITEYRHPLASRIKCKCNAYIYASSEPK
jgi:methionyl-tRNA formyltransferase